MADLQKSLRQVRDSLSRTLNTEIQDTLHRLGGGGDGVMENIVQFQRGKHMASIEVPLGKQRRHLFVFFFNAEIGPDRTDRVTSWVLNQLLKNVPATLWS